MGVDNRARLALRVCSERPTPSCDAVANTHTANTHTNGVTLSDVTEADEHADADAIAFAICDCRTKQR
jgi:hypothetical protein